MNFSTEKVRSSCRICRVDGTGMRRPKRISGFIVSPCERSDVLWNWPCDGAQLRQNVSGRIHRASRDTPWHRLMAVEHRDKRSAAARNAAFYGAGRDIADLARCLVGEAAGADQ